MFGVKILRVTLVLLCFSYKPVLSFISGRFLTLREAGHRLRIFHRWMLRIIFELKRRSWRKESNEKLRRQQSSLNISSVIKYWI
jgi:hypothetical protein